MRPSLRTILMKRTSPRHEMKEPKYVRSGVRHDAFLDASIAEKYPYGLLSKPMCGSSIEEGWISNYYRPKDYWTADYIS